MCESLSILDGLPPSASTRWSKSYICPSTGYEPKWFVLLPCSFEILYNAELVGVSFVTPDQRAPILAYANDEWTGGGAPVAAFPLVHDNVERLPDARPVGCVRGARQEGGLRLLLSHVTQAGYLRISQRSLRHPVKDNSKDSLRGRRLTRPQGASWSCLQARLRSPLRAQPVRRAALLSVLRRAPVDKSRPHRFLQLPLLRALNLLCYQLDRRGR